MPRNHELRLKLTSEELTKLKKKAQDAGLTLSSFSRLVLLSSKVTLTSEMQEY